MLELAHERQFVVSQQGWDTADFEVQHSRRIEDCLRQLETYFDSFATDEPYRPASPHAADVIHCWDPNSLPRMMPPLYLSTRDVQDGHVAAATSSPQAIRPAVSPSKRPSMCLSSMVADSDDEDDEEDDNSNDISNSWQQSVLDRSRMATSLPIHGNRASKFVRQRSRYESKLATDLLPVSKKRSSQWMTNKVEDEAIVTERSRSIAAIRPSHDRVVRNDGT